MNKEAIKRIKGYCCEVNRKQWDELARVADEVGVNRWNKDLSYNFVAYSNGILQTWSEKIGKLIPFPDFLAKLRGDEEWTPKAGEMVEVSDKGEKWFEREFIGKGKGKYIVWNESEYPTFFLRCRPIRPTITREEAEKQLGKRIID